MKGAAYKAKKRWKDAIRKHGALSVRSCTAEMEATQIIDDYMSAVYWEAHKELTESGGDEYYAEIAACESVAAAYKWLELIE